MTGVQCRIEDAFVLNRREAHDLLGLLKDRTASLRRVIEQLSPLDAQDGYEAVPAARRATLAPKKHRLICKAMASALAPGFPEITLFLAWPQYQKNARQTIKHGANANQKPAQPAVTARQDHENKCLP
jgi:hypothetical protein